MMKLIGLFSNQTDAEQAMTALNTVGIPKGDLQMMVVTPGTAVAASFNLTNQTTPNFRQNARNGGVLIIVNMAKNSQHLAQAKDILQQESLSIAESSA